MEAREGRRGKQGFRGKGGRGSELLGGGYTQRGERGM